MRKMIAQYIVFAIFSFLRICNAGEAKNPSDIAQFNRLCSTVDSLVSARSWTRAENTARNAVKFASDHFGNDDSLVTVAYQRLYTVFWAQGSYKEAEMPIRSALDVAAKCCRTNSAYFAALLNDLGLCLRYQGRYHEAEPLFLRALKVWEQAGIKDDPRMASAYNNLASIYHSQGEYSKAEPLCKKALDMRESIYGKNHAIVAQSQMNLASIYKDQGKYDKAEQLFKSALKIFEKVGDKDSIQIAACLNSVASLKYLQGNYSEAESLYLLTLHIRENAFGLDHPDVATSLNNLALFYRQQRKLEKAEQLLRRALEIREQKLGPEHPVVATCFNNLAGLYQEQGKFAEAEELYRHAIEIRVKTYGMQNPAVATYMNNLASIYQKRKRYAEAESFYKKSLAIREKTLGKKHPDVANSLNNLALLYHEQERYAEAVPLYKRALKIREKALGKEHPDVANLLYNLARTYEAQGEFKKAESPYTKSDAVATERLIYSAGYMNERDLLQYLDAEWIKRSAFENFAFAYCEQKPEFAQKLYNHLLTFKGASGRSATALRAVIATSGDKKLVEVADEMVATRWQIAKLEAQDDTSAISNIALLRSKADSLEQILTKMSSDYRDFEEEFEIEWGDIKHKLKKDEVAIEFTTVYDRKSATTCYVALVVFPKEKFPKVVRIGDEALIDTAINIYSLVAKNMIPANHIPNVARKLYDIFWLPLDTILSNVKRIYIAPEGELFKINFGILPDSTGKLVMERYDIRTVNSTIDLVKPKEKRSKAPCVIFGGPDYDLAEVMSDESPDSKEQGRQARSERSADIGTITFYPLPGSLEESQAVASLLSKYKFSTKLYTGKNATEKAFKSINAPKILHVATHGFVLANQDRTKFPKARIESPMARSGLALAGANRISKGIAIPEYEEDGILTAMELMEIPMRGTELVVLSACETGLGTWKSGEGVFGLRRAMQLAGAKYVLISLWAVPDKETEELMKIFYDKWLDGTEIGEALRIAQMEIRKKVIERYGNDMPYYWGAFVLVGK